MDVFGDQLKICSTCLDMIKRHNIKRLFHSFRSDKTMPSFKIENLSLAHLRRFVNVINLNKYRRNVRTLDVAINFYSSYFSQPDGKQGFAAFKVEERNLKTRQENHNQDDKSFLPFEMETSGGLSPSTNTVIKHLSISHSYSKMED